MVIIIYSVSFGDNDKGKLLRIQGFGNGKSYLNKKNFIETRNSEHF